MSFSLVPSFAQRYPKDEEDIRPARPDLDHDRHARPDRASFLIETCCTTFDEALSAQTRGANRIELCTDLSVGGVTPSRDLIREVVGALSIPVNALIRPISKLDFVYDEDDLQQMTADIDFCKSIGAAGIVVGALTPEGTIDRAAMQRLIAAARPLPVTFHRAFDVCTADPFIALDQIIALGCTRLLTSGQAPTAWEGRCLINLLVRRAGRRLIVMPGRGVTPANLAALAAATHAAEYHGTALP